MTSHFEDDALPVFSHASPVMSHTPSIGSDAVSLASTSTSHNTPAFVASINPAPEYVSKENASQLAAGFVDVRRDSDYVEGNSWPRPGGKAAVTESALAMLNAFLDKQLYDILSVARSTSLVMLKPAVTDVLKKKLARNAIANAEENLEDLLALQADGESEDERRPSSQTSAKWNVEFTWKRLRLRVMMRSEKSDFDIDDDERYVHEEALSATISETAGAIGLATEIFLAGVLDYLADTVLRLATQAAAMHPRRPNSSNAPTSPNLDNPIVRVLVQESDIEKAALNSPLDRQWRMWRKALRSASRISQPASSAANSPIVDRRSSLDHGFPYYPENHYPEHILASNIPLPMTIRDVDEIEVPGLARYPDERLEDDNTPGAQKHKRARTIAHPYALTEPSNATERWRPTSVRTPLAAPFVDASGAWPVELPATEIAQPRAGEPTRDDQVIAESDPVRPESKDSTCTDLSSGINISTLRSVHRPKRLAIYGPSSNKFSAINISREGLDPIEDERPFSPGDSLIGRNLEGSTSNKSVAHAEEDIPASAFGTVAEQSRLYDTSEDDSSAKPSPIAKSPGSLPRNFSGLGITRHGSDASKSASFSEQQRASIDLTKSRRGSKLTDSTPSSPGKRGSLRQLSLGRDSLDDRRKLSSPLTSEREFDMLLNSDETVKFTLTPDSVREVPDQSHSPQLRFQKVKFGSVSTASASKENVSKRQDSDAQSIRNFSKRQDGDAQSVRSFRSATWSLSASKDKTDKALAESKRLPSMIRPSLKNVSASPSGHVAREAVMQTESTRDFADFIRSTGPDEEPNPIVPILASRSVTSLRANSIAPAATSQATPTSTNASAEPAASPPLPTALKNSGKYIPRSPLGPPKSRAALRSGMTARGATGNSGSNDDLIDFIRSGPPESAGKARLTNYIAPFMDFDDDDDYSMRSPSIYRPPTSSTLNSRTGLLGHGPGSFRQSNSSQLTQNLPLPSPSLPSPLYISKSQPDTVTPNMTQRKQCRIKDPYAIPGDSDDEDDGDDSVGALPDGPVNGSAQASAGATRVHSNSISSLNSPANKISPSIDGGMIPASSSGLLNSGDTSSPGYEPSVTSMHSATTTSAIRPAQITSQVSSGGLVPRSNKPKLEMRSAGGSKNARLDALHKSSTGDLADFLMSSGPAEPSSRRAADGAPAPVVGSNGGKSEKKKGPKFWQRKATYLDMP